MTEKQYILKEVQSIISDIESELNAISKPAKKQIHNTVYVISTNLCLESGVNVPSQEDTRVFAFIIKKSFWLNKMTLELRSSENYMKTVTTDNYKKYINKESLDIFDVESLVVIKHFLLSFAS